MIVRGNLGFYMGPMDSVIFVHTSRGQISVNSAIHPSPYNNYLHEAKDETNAEFLVDQLVNFILNGKPDLASTNAIFDFRDLEK